MATIESKNSHRVLVVDDEKSISDLIATSLRFVGFDVRTAATGSEALTVAEEFKPQAVVLDVMLPDLDGFEVCRQLRSEGLNIGVLFLTAKDGMEDKVAGLNSSATVKASDPVAAVRTSKPTKRRLVEIRSLMLFSSSTTRMRYELLLSMVAMV